MRIVMFYQSVVSDWNHGNAHFLRGLVTELVARGHTVTVLEPEDSWTRTRLVADQGPNPVLAFQRAYPTIRFRQYTLEKLDLDRELGEADLVLVHEWNDPLLIQAVGRFRQLVGGFHLLFHDTHHRIVTEPEKMADYRLDAYDGVLAFGEVLRQQYLERCWTQRAWTWHEAADVRVFQPLEGRPTDGDLVWIGNWGDGERTAELEQFLISPVEALGLRARVHGVRYPAVALTRLAAAGIEYGGWIANYEVPEAFARFKLTLHIPRRPYVEALPGIPTIRVFEALACGIPLVCSPWDDAEQLFSPGEDYLTARNGSEMRDRIGAILGDHDAALAMAENGRQTILSRHTCGHRVDELLAIVAALRSSEESTARRQSA